MSVIFNVTNSLKFQAEFAAVAKQIIGKTCVTYLSTGRVMTYLSTGRAVKSYVEILIAYK